MLVDVLVTRPEMFPEWFMGRGYFSLLRVTKKNYLFVLKTF